MVRGKKTLGEEGYDKLKQSKISVRAVLKEATHLAIDIPDFTGKGGTSTTGNVIHSLLSDENKLQVLVSQVPEQFQDKLHDCISRGYAIVKLYNSSEKINVPVFKDFCFTTKKLFFNFIQ